MNPKRFNKLVNNRLDSYKEVLLSKEKEYSDGIDRLHNFKVASEFLRSTPEQALMGMWVKHLVSVLDLINNPSTATPHLLKEKFGDVINYALLAEAALTERMESAMINPVGTKAGLAGHTDKNIIPAWARVKANIHGIGHPKDDDYHESQE